MKSGWGCGFLDCFDMVVLGNGIFLWWQEEFIENIVG